MFQLLSKHSFYLVRTYSDRVFLGFESPEGELHLYPYSLDGELGEELKFSKKEPIRWIYLRSGLWLIEYEEASKEDTHIYSIEGEWQQTVPNLDADLYILKTEEDWVYFINERFIKYNLSTHEYRDLGMFPLKEPFFYEGSHRGLHFFTCERKSQLVAMRDKDGQGLEEVYRLDFAESGRGYSLWRNGVVPGEIDFINFYGSDLWVTTQKHLHRIDVATGKVLERRDETLPKMFIQGTRGYSLYGSYYTLFDFEAGRMLCDERRDRFAYEGKEYSSEYTGLLLHEGIFYVSVRVSGIFFLAAFDVQTEEFVWHDLWGGWDIDSVHIVGDRMIAHSHDEVRIYQRAD
ncbi:MAG: hypothetical protein ACFNO5_06555 [Porphyromonas pasteri]